MEWPSDLKGEQSEQGGKSEGTASAPYKPLARNALFLGREQTTQKGKQESKYEVYLECMPRKKWFSS